MQTKMLVQRKTEQPPSTEGKKQEQKNVPKERQNVRTTDLQIMIRIACNDPDSLSREEFLMLQSAIGYRQAMKLIERGKERKERKKADKQNTSDKDKPIKKTQKNLQIYKPQSLRKQDSELNDDKKAEEKPVQLKKEDDKGNKSELNNNEGTGMPEYLKSGLEAISGVSLSDVNVHRNSDKPQQVGALAYTQGNNIHIAPGQDKHLAHEGWHAVQQKQKRVEPTIQMKSGILLNDNNGLEREADIEGEKAEETGKKMLMAGAGDNVPRDNKITNILGNSNSVIQKKDDGSQPKPKVKESELEEIQLKGMTNFIATAKIDEYLKENTSGAKIKVKYGDLAHGTVKISKAGDSYKMLPQALSVIRHPFFGQSDVMKTYKPCLVVSLDKGYLDGFLSVWNGTKVPQSDFLQSIIKSEPSMLGLRGLSLDDSLKIVNGIDNGILSFGIKNASVKVGGAFGCLISFSFEPDTGNIGFTGRADIKIPGLAMASLSLERTTQGKITGSAGLAVKLTSNIAGEVRVIIDGESVTGEGSVGYTGEKLSGNVTLRLVDKNSMQSAGADPNAALKPVPKATKSQKPQYVLNGEGDLMFKFTDWLSGTAHCEVDEKGNVTIVGQIVPQKELILFEQKDFVKQIFKVEVRASYGIPVVGNVFLFANIGLDAFAKLGPAKLYNIIAEGTYSTDPQKCNNFSIQASLNISAAAGVRLRAEGGAGLEILGHDIKAGIGISAIAGLQAYAEATPIIGYKENAQQGQDKKGQFFIAGELEIAAQPSFGLEGDLFVEVDSPWWSPLPDKKWIWPLVSKTYPLGGSFGILAKVEHVLGSKQVPEVEFGKVDFSADKFMTDLINDKTGSKKSDEKKPGKWNEKNSQAAQPPKANGKDSNNAKKGAQGSSLDSIKKPKSALTKNKNEANPNARTADGKTVKQHQEQTIKNGQKGNVKNKGKQREVDKNNSQKKSRDEQLIKGLASLKDLKKKYDKDGAIKEELSTEVNTIKKKYGISSINVLDNGKSWKFKYGNSASEVIAGPKKGEKVLSPKTKFNIGSKTNELWVERGKPGSKDNVVKMTGSKDIEKDKAVWGQLDQKSKSKVSTLKKPKNKTFKLNDVGNAAKAADNCLGDSPKVKFKLSSRSHELWVKKGNKKNIVMMGNDERKFNSQKKDIENSAANIESKKEIIYKLKQSTEKLEQVKNQEQAVTELNKAASLLSEADKALAVSKDESKKTEPKKKDAGVREASDKKWKAAVVNGRKVYKYADMTAFHLAKPEKVDTKYVHPVVQAKINSGATNLELMKQGYAPIGLDGRPINLHHVIGQEPGPMVELSGSAHSKYHKPLHGLIEDGNSFRNDPKKEAQYERFRKKYWKERAKDFEQS